MLRWRRYVFSALLLAPLAFCGNESTTHASGQSAVAAYLSSGSNPEVAVNTAVVAFSGAGLLALYVWNRFRQRH